MKADFENIFQALVPNTPLGDLDELWSRLSKDPLMRPPSATGASPTAVWDRECRVACVLLKKPILVLHDDGAINRGSLFFLDDQGTPKRQELPWGVEMRKLLAIISTGTGLLCDAKVMNKKAKPNTQCNLLVIARGRDPNRRWCLVEDSPRSAYSFDTRSDGPTPTEVPGQASVLEAQSEVRSSVSKDHADGDVVTSPPSKAAPEVTPATTPQQPVKPW